MDFAILDYDENDFYSIHTVEENSTALQQFNNTTKTLCYEYDGLKFYISGFCKGRVYGLCKAN